MTAVSSSPPLETPSSGARRILVINGHPDPSPERLCAALAAAYARGARAAGREVETLDIGSLEFPLVRSLHDYQTSPLPPDIAAAQDAIGGADHLVIVFPIWFGGLPAMLKGFFEQLMRRGFALSSPRHAMLSLLSGKSARLVVTMGLPAPIFHLVLGGHGLRALERGLFWVTDVRPRRRTILGSATNPPKARVDGWLRRLEALGRAGR